MKESLIRESVIREFVGDINKNIKCLEEEIVKMSNKINKRQMNGLVACKINNEMEEFEMVLPKRNKIAFMKLKNNVSNYLNDLLVD